MTGENLREIPFPGGTKGFRFREKQDFCSPPEGMYAMRKEAFFVLGFPALCLAECIRAEFEQYPEEIWEEFDEAVADGYLDGLIMLEYIFGDDVQAREALGSMAPEGVATLNLYSATLDVARVRTWEWKRIEALLAANAGEVEQWEYVRLRRYLSRSHEVKMILLWQAEMFYVEHRDCVSEMRELLLTLAAILSGRDG